ncbi:MAG: hypothetical protein KM296_00130 [Brockia lithotrophica]|nr:hypothetical protein [Brockia lithotrophica]
MKTIEFLGVVLGIVSLVALGVFIWSEHVTANIVQQAADAAAKAYAETYGSKAQKEAAGRLAADKVISSILNKEDYSKTVENLSAPPGTIVGTLTNKNGYYFIDKQGPFLDATGTALNYINELVAAKVDTSFDPPLPTDVIKQGTKKEVEQKNVNGFELIRGGLAYKLYVGTYSTNESDVKNKAKLSGSGVWKSSLDAWVNTHCGAETIPQDSPFYEYIFKGRTFPQKDWSVIWDGYIYAPVDGVYTLRVITDDYTRIDVDGRKVVEGFHTQPYSDGEIYLTRGYHEFHVFFSQAWCGYGIKVYWKKPGDSQFNIIPKSYFAYEPLNTQTKTITLKTDQNAKQIAGGNLHTLALDKFGRLFTSGWNEYYQRFDYAKTGDANLRLDFQQVFANEKVKQIAAAYDVSAFVTDGGKLYVSGYYVEYTDDALKPKCIAGCGEINVFIPNDKNNGGHTEKRNIKVEKVVLGQYFGIFTDGKNVYAFGWNGNTRRGILEGIQPGTYTPNLVNIPDLSNPKVTVKDIAATHWEGYVLLSNGKVYRWGNGATPYEVKTPGGVTFERIYAGDDFAFAVDGAGNLWAIGPRPYLGDGECTGYSFYEFKRVSLPEPVISVAAGKSSVYAVTKSNRLFAWGVPQFGSIPGKQDGVPICKPTELSLPDGKKAQSVFAGSYNVYVITTDGLLYGAGLNTAGQVNESGVSPSGWFRMYPFSGAGTYTYEIPVKRDFVFDVNNSYVKEPTFIGEENKYHISILKNENLFNRLRVFFISNNPENPQKITETSFTPREYYERMYDVLKTPYSGLWELRSGGSFGTATISGKDATYVKADEGKYPGFTSTTTFRGYGEIRLKVYLPQNTSSFPYWTGVYIYEEGAFRFLSMNVYNDYNGYYRLVLRANSRTEEITGFKVPRDGFYELRLSYDKNSITGKVVDEGGKVLASLTLPTNGEYYSEWRFVVGVSNRRGYSNLAYYREAFVRDQTLPAQSVDIPVKPGTSLPSGNYTVLIEAYNNVTQKTHEVALAFKKGSSIPVYRPIDLSFDADGSSFAKYWKPNMEQEVIINFRNDSSVTLRRGDKIVLLWKGASGNVASRTEIPLVHDVYPGGSYRVSAKIVSPSTPGVYQVELQVFSGSNASRLINVFPGVTVVGKTSAITEIYPVKQNVVYNAGKRFNPAIDVKFFEENVNGEEFVTARVTYHLPILGRLDKVFPGNWKPVYDITVQSKVRLEKPRF